jgi:predicted nucleic acid-binding protein
MTRAVCDTGPLLHLSEAHILHTLRLLDEAHIPPQVAIEMGQILAGWQTPDWLTVGALDAFHAAEAAAWLQAELLHAGEAEAIALARQIQADWLLTDDSAARLFAGNLGLEVHGSLGIVLWAAAIGFFSRMDAEDALRRLAASSLWVSSRALHEAHVALDEIYGT